MAGLMNYGIILMVVVYSAGSEPDYLSIYRRIPQHYLKAMPQKVFEHTTVEACSRACVMETEFECKSFDYDNSQRECHLHNHTHHEPLIGLQGALDTDHYRTAYEKLFNRIPNHVITMRHKRKIQGLRVEECARRCILEMNFRCAGFDYGNPTRVCLLTEKVPADVDGLKRRANTDYYERKTNGPLSRFINYGYGSLQTIEGVQTHTKIVLGVNLDACAQLCLAETAFVCASFDYAFREQSCQLSKYIAAHVHGMRTDFRKRYQVMHFEIIDESLEYFYPTPYASILGRNDKTFLKVTPDTCARRCLEERDFICRSFDYQIQKGTCLLSHVTGSDAGGLYTLDGVHVHHFEMKPSLDCGGVFHQERGTIASPNWPRYYSHHLNCTWSLNVPEFKIVRIEIHHINLGKQTENACARVNDVLSVTELTNEGRSIDCIENTQTELSSKTNHVDISFVTNADHDAQGFRMFYYADWPCKRVFTKDNGEFASPRWPNTYPSQSDCHWTIKAPPLSQILLHFNSIQLEDHTGSNCKTAYDRIDIYEGASPSDTPITTLCGIQSSVSFTSSGSDLFVAFTSDSRVQAKGFHVSYRFTSPTTTSTSTTSLPSTSLTLTSIKSTFHKDKVNINDKAKAIADETVGNRNSEEQITNINNGTLEHGHVYNSSVAVNMAMVGSRGTDEAREDVLDAEFKEPHYVLIDERDGTEDKSRDGKISDDIGMGKRPDIHLDIVQSEKTYTAIIWGVVVALCTTCLIMTIVILFICRYYRRRLPKLRPRQDITGTPDENASLCQKGSDPDGRRNVHEYPDEGDVEDAARLPLPRDHTAPPDVEFHNPLYLESPNPGGANRPTSLAQELVTMTTIPVSRDLDHSTSDSPRSDGHRSDGRRSVYTPSYDSDLELGLEHDDTTSTALLLDDRPQIHIDCFTTV